MQRTHGLAKLHVGIEPVEEGDRPAVQQPSECPKSAHCGSPDSWTGKVADSQHSQFCVGPATDLDRYPTGVVGAQMRESRLSIPPLHDPRFVDETNCLALRRIANGPANYDGAVSARIERTPYCGRTITSRQSLPGRGPCTWSALACQSKPSARDIVPLRSMRSHW